MVGYRVVRALMRLLLWLFYRRVELVGRHHIPPAGPVILAANHHNALVDAMIVVASLDRPVIVLAKAPLFRHFLVGPFLRMMGAVPVHRRCEAGDDPRRNDAMFAAATAALGAGGLILIFPEGGSQPQPVLSPLRTGAARILLAAETAGAGVGVRLLPVGMVYDDPGTFRSASAHVSIGEPVRTSDLVAAYHEGGDNPVRRLTARLAEAIRARIVEAADQDTLTLLAVLERAWREELAGRGPAGPVSASGLEPALAWRQRAMRAARYLDADAPRGVADLQRRAARYRARLDKLGITGEQLGRPYTVGLVLRYALTNALWLACHGRWGRE